jgi:p-aminobenzoyl-glutamate transporter AbgT
MPGNNYFATKEHHRDQKHKKMKRRKTMISLSMTRYNCAKNTTTTNQVAWAITMKRIPPKALEWQENHKDNGNDVASSNNEPKKKMF